MALFVFGSNSFGQLGVSYDTISSTHIPTRLKMFDTREIVKIAAGKIHAVILCDKNELYSWGVNDDDALGRETGTIEEELPDIVHFKQDIIDISAGACHTALVTKSHRLFACGTFKSEGGVFGIASQKQRHKVFTEIKGYYNVMQVVSGDNHIIAIAKNGAVLTSGVNQSLQLGRVCRLRNKYRSLEPSSITNPLKKHTNPMAGVDAGNAHSIAWDKKQNCYGWGSNAYGQLGNDAKEDCVYNNTPIMGSVIKVVCGSNHTLFLTTDNKVYGCGDNSHHQLGLADLKEIRIPQLIFENADDIAAGGDNTIVKSGNKLFSCGFNRYGECGHEESLVKQFTEIIFDFGNITSIKIGLDFTLVSTN